MEFKSFKNIIQPRLKSITAESQAMLFYTILADSLNDWFNNRLIIQTGTVVGTITYPSSATPYTNMVLKPDMESLNISATIMYGYRLTEQKIFPNIFNYIGTTINQCLRSWSSFSPAWGRSGQIAQVAGLAIHATFPDGINTSHFYSFGEKFIKRIQKEPPENRNTFNVFWEQFEVYLKAAIMQSPMAYGNATGSALGGMFNGQGIVKLSAEV